MLELKNLALEEEGARVWSLPHVQLEPGTMAYLLGPNGVGKSTFLRACVGLLPAKGQVLWRGRALTVDDCVYLSSVLPQHDARSCEDVVSAHIYQYFAIEPSQSSIEDALKKLGLWSVRNQSYAKLSDGQKKRAQLALLTYAKGRKIWLLDEAYAALDAQCSGLLDALIHEHLRLGGVVLLADHNVREGLEAKRLSLEWDVKEAGGLCS